MSIIKNCLGIRKIIPIFCEKVDDELDVAVIDTPDIFALVPDAASPAIAFNIPAMSVLLKPVVFKDRCMSVFNAPNCVAT